MTFALSCHNKRSRMATKPLSLALGYAMEVAVGSGDIVLTAESDFTDERGFGNSIRIPGA
jgi:hypothetical protein